MPTPRTAVPGLLRQQPFSVGTARTVVSKDVLYGPSYTGLTRGAHTVTGESVDHGRRIQAMRA